LVGGLRERRSCRYASRASNGEQADCGEIDVPGEHPARSAFIISKQQQVNAKSPYRRLHLPSIKCQSSNKTVLAPLPN
jgi:hypothetical protein